VAKLKMQMWAQPFHFT